MESYAPQKALIFQRLYCFTSPSPFTQESNITSLSSSYLP